MDQSSQLRSRFERLSKGTGYAHHVFREFFEARKMELQFSISNDQPAVWFATVRHWDKVDKKKSAPFFRSQAFFPASSLPPPTSPRRMEFPACLSNIEYASLSSILQPLELERRAVNVRVVGLACIECRGARQQADGQLW